MRKIAFTPDAYDEFIEWLEKDKDVGIKIKSLVKDITRDPFKGIGKPEPLKGKYKGCWSRRITQEHRMIYEITDLYILIIKCKGHYD